MIDHIHKYMHACLLSATLALLACSTTCLESSCISEVQRGSTCEKQAGRPLNEGNRRFLSGSFERPEKCRGSSLRKEYIEIYGVGNIYRYRYIDMIGSVGLLDGWVYTVGGGWN